MSDEAIRRYRKLLKASTAAVFAVLAVVVILGISSTGQWFSVQAEDMTTEQDGLRLSAGFDLVLESNINYDIEDLECELFLIDRLNGSELSLGKILPVDITARDSTHAHVSADIFAPGAILILSDLIDREGSVLHFNLKVTCGYLMGMADIDLDMDIDLPLSEPGGKLTVEKHRSASELRVTVSGLADKLVPEDWSVRFSGNGLHTDLTLRSDDGTTVLSLESDGNLKKTLDTIAASDDMASEVTGEPPFPADRGALEALSSLYELMGRI